LRSFYKFLLKKGTIEKNPALKLSPLKTKKSLPQFVRENDMTLILDHNLFEDSFIGKRDHLIIEILYGTGIRLSELIELKVNKVDVFNNSIKVLGKRNKERIIPITHNLSGLIKSYISLKNVEFKGNVNEYLIVSIKGGKSYPMMINRIVKKYLQGISVDKKSPHILRHTYATHLLERGADLNAVKDLLGHQSLAATQIYTHNSLGKLKKVFDQAHPKA
ncbi:MAG: tyrosine-type recombinase/integrase, partial [Cyclobacteriaceae bacterium]|nr:tyrosine-type recombinase/integrase [Cyclobacteriaceae bacterium]